MNAPVNVLLEKPTIPISNWDFQAKKWLSLNIGIEGNPNFYPLTIKAAYIIGIIHDYCESINILCHHSMTAQIIVMPAYSLFCSAVEILGRCISGNASTNSRQDLINGFKWLLKNEYYTVNNSAILYRTSDMEYSIKYLVGLRNFTAHGQSTTTANVNITFDEEILNPLPILLADGLERYWSRLQSDEQLCNDLAKANIIPLRDWPIYNLWFMLEKDENGKYKSITEIFSNYIWG